MSVRQYPLSIFSLNLHGYHPMGEANRWLENRTGRIRSASETQLSERHQGLLNCAADALFLYTTEELDRGHRRRLDRLAYDLGKMAPDVICLQEVAAGCPWTARDCSIFEREFPQDWFEANSAQRLHRRLIGASQLYSLVVACRGNTGWHTDQRTFAEERVVTIEGSQKRVIFDFNANPYPGGILVEGMAILLREPWQMVQHEKWNLTVNADGDRQFVQAMAICCKNAPADLQQADPIWFVLANVHLGHKISNFEQALAIRETLVEFAGRIARERDWLSERSFVGVVVAGDFNASLYRPATGYGDVSMIPWEMEVPGQFDLRAENPSFEGLLDRLRTLNDDDSQKSWAKIADPQWAERRIRASAERCVAMAKDADIFPPLRDCLESATVQRHFDGIPCAGTVTDRIDHILFGSQFTVNSACVVYPDNPRNSLAGTSDHPALFAEVEIV